MNFHDDPGLGPFSGSSSILIVINMRRIFRIVRRCECPSLPLGGGEMPEVGSVEFSLGWTLNELSELVRELFNVPPVTLGECVRRRIVREVLCGVLLLRIHLHHHAT